MTDPFRSTSFRRRFSISTRVVAFLLCLLVFAFAIR